MSEEMKTKRENVVANLKSIRVGKTKLLAMLGSLKEREVNGEEIDSSLIFQLVQSYDGLKDQEEKYLTVLRGIVQEHIHHYAEESKKTDEQEGDNKEEKTIQDENAEFLKEIEQVQNEALAAFDKNEELEKTLKERLELKQHLDELRAQQNKDLQENEITKERIKQEKEAISRAEQVRDRLKKEVAKRSLEADKAEAKAVQETLDVNSRIPELPAVTPLSTEVEDGAIEDKIKRHIESIKARRQRMKECGTRLNEMMDYKQTYNQAVGRTNDLAALSKRLENATIEDLEVPKEESSE